MNDIKFGIAMEGCEDLIINSISKFSDGKLTSDEYILYIEIGFAEARTTKAINTVLDRLGLKYKSVGIDLQNGWSLNYQEALKNINAKTEILLLKDNSDNSRLEIYGYIQHKYSDAKTMIILIDGNHNYDAVAKDWETVINLITKNDVKSALIMFHDSGIKDQTLDKDINVQPKGINVRKFLTDSGLLEGKLEIEKFEIIEKTDFENPDERGRGIFIINLEKKI